MDVSTLDTRSSTSIREVRAIRVTRRDRLVGGALAAMLSLVLATPAPLLLGDGDHGWLGILVALGLLGAPIVLLAGAWLAPLAIGDPASAAFTIGFVAAFGGLLLVATISGMSASSGFGDGLVAFGFILMFGLPIAVVLAVILTIPMGALWAWLLRRVSGASA